MSIDLLTDLDRDGIVRLPAGLIESQLCDMRTAFDSRLARMRWNDSWGYEKTEPYRHMVEDVLTLDQGFVDLALHPVVTSVLRAYLGRGFQLVEAKGWKSLPTTKNFHGWHGDAWYDRTAVLDMPREVKLALYLSDVKTGAFSYVRRSHRQQRPRMLGRAEAERLPQSRITEMVGPAGTAFLFDTSGIHRQGCPILEPRQAVFLNYHDPAVPLQREDVDYYRYHPLLLNAAFLGNLSSEDQRILGFGDRRRYIHAFQRRSGQDVLEPVFRATFEAKLRADLFVARVTARVGRLRTVVRRAAAMTQREG